MGWGGDSNYRNPITGSLKANSVCAPSIIVHVGTVVESLKKYCAIGSALPEVDLSMSEICVANLRYSYIEENERIPLVK
jgi:hypothetical protein